MQEVKRQVTVEVEAEVGASLYERSRSSAKREDGIPTSR